MTLLHRTSEASQADGLHWFPMPSMWRHHLVAILALVAQHPGARAVLCGDELIAILAPRHVYLDMIAEAARRAGRAR